jgi:hypothetical protein
VYVAKPEITVIMIVVSVDLKMIVLELELNVCSVRGCVREYVEVNQNINVN